MQRFFVPPETLATAEVRIGGDTARQINRVLRMQVGDEICLLDGLGWEYLVRITGFTKDEVVGVVLERMEGRGEPAYKVGLYLSLLNKADKFEWALQKCTELGAHSFTPVRAAHSIADVPGQSKVERWERIIQEAAEQSGRALLPRLYETITLSQALEAEAHRLSSLPHGEHITVMPSLGAERSLGDVLAGLEWDKGKSMGTVSIIIGPEGGFSDGELREAEEAGVALVTLGPRTLRAETAAVAALTMVLYELGEMG